jgi:hypothetical protein
MSAGLPEFLKQTFIRPVFVAFLQSNMDIRFSSTTWKESKSDLWQSRWIWQSYCKFVIHHHFDGVWIAWSVASSVEKKGGKFAGAVSKSISMDSSAWAVRKTFFRECMVIRLHSR